MNADMAKGLRAPFSEGLVSKLPKITCGNCSKAQSRNCDKHSKSKCQICNSYITSAHLHLDYVGHAETTDRLLDVDPEWTWEPVAYGHDGLPLLDSNGGLWMRLTVGGVTRLGYGDAQGKNGPNAVKEAIGDGIRNAAMRFGVALDLWAKSDLAAIHADKETGEIAGPATEPQQRPAQAPELAAAPQQVTAKQELWRFAQSVGMSAEKLANEFSGFGNGGILNQADDSQILAFLAWLKQDMAGAA